jgi:hypothetical protein
MLYCKSLAITSGVKAEMGVGSIVNLQSNDGSKIWNLPQYLHIVWNGPFQVDEIVCDGRTFASGILLPDHHVAED